MIRQLSGYFSPHVCLTKDGKQLVYVNRRETVRKQYTDLDDNTSCVNVVRTLSVNTYDLDSGKHRKKWLLGACNGILKMGFSRDSKYLCVKTCGSTETELKGNLRYIDLQNGKEGKIERTGPSCPSTGSDEEAWDVGPYRVVHGSRGTAVTHVSNHTVTQSDAFKCSKMVGDFLTPDGGFGIILVQHVGRGKHNVHLVRLDKCTVYSTFQTDQNPICCVVSPQGEYLYMSILSSAFHPQKKICAIRLSDKQQLWERSCDWGISGLFFFPDTSTECVKYGTCTHLCLSTDNQYVYAASDSQDFYVLRADTGAVVCKRVNNDCLTRQNTSNLLATPDGKYVVVASSQTVDVFYTPQHVRLVRLKRKWVQFLLRWRRRKGPQLLANPLFTFWTQNPGWVHTVFTNMLSFVNL